jgi:membrane protein YqaA with SNARE-associated domain
MGVIVVAALWGLAEGTVFFLVPDVCLTWVALRDRRAALRACAAALAGALVGGLLMYEWGARDPAAARALLDRVPAISQGMIARVETEIAARGALALFIGPLRGTPYKIYAVLSGERGEGLALFLAVSVPARLLRFVLLTLLAAWVSARPPVAAWSLRAKRTVHAAFWGAFYSAYLLLLPS